MLSVDLNIKVKGKVLFSKNNLTFSVHFFVKHPVVCFADAEYHGEILSITGEIF